MAVLLDDLPPALRVGVFAQPRTFPAWIRFSNGSGTPQQDPIGDGRGMAIKLMGVAQSASTTQDFVMINYPAFFVRNAADYVDFQSASNPLRFFFPGLNPFHFRLAELTIARAIIAQSVLNPLNVRYWSMTPYCLGDAACKFSARPAAPLRLLLEQTSRNSERHLAGTSASFDLMVQLRTRPDAMPIEDPTVIWDKGAAPFVPVASITTPEQSFDSPEQNAFCENLSFTPWHCIDAHRPLGGINRVRRVVYEAISRLRHDLNGAPRREPTDFTVWPPKKRIGRRARRRKQGMLNLPRIFAATAGSAIDGWAWLSGKASAVVVNTIVDSTRTRPHPWSTFSDYTSWQGLTDRTYLARHLPPADVPRKPPAEKVRELFKRRAAGAVLSDKSTCLFPAFAQYLTDGFIRTVPTNVACTTTNHEIDLCPLYGRTPGQTALLRLKSNAPGQRGKLKSQKIGDEEYPPFLYPNNNNIAAPAFADLDPPLLSPKQPTPAPPPDLPLDRLRTLFAIGGDRANSTPFTAMINTLLLREHNRVAGELETRNPAWDDERVFQTARNIMIPMFIKVVVEQYINHVTPLPFSLRADPSVAWTANWNRPNWITAEFSLLYRWHSLMPDVILWSPGRSIPIGDFTLNNQPLIDVGLDAAFSAAASQPTGELGAFNTADALLPIEILAVEQARANRLDTYNKYRVAFGMPPAKQFSDISKDIDVAALLQQLYGEPDNVEFYPGLFAEDRVPDCPLPELLLRMVAVDAFSQALTNPLLSEHVFNANTFTQWGLDLINNTSKLGDILARNVPARGKTPIEMTQSTWHYMNGP